MRWAVLVAVAACSGRDPTVLVDAAQPPIAYEVSVGNVQTRLDVHPTVYIDGAPTMQVRGTYASLAEAESFEHHVELRYEDQVLTTLTVSSDLEDCLLHAGSALVLSIADGLGEYDSGDLRYSGDQIQFDSGGCIGDAFDIPRCYCAATERCIPRVLRASPLFTQMACAPAGAKQHGDACSLIPDAAGAYDDCDKGLFCYQGTCHGLCRDTGGAPTGVLPAEYPPEAQLCD